MVSDMEADCHVAATESHFGSMHKIDSIHFMRYLKQA